MSLSNKFAKQQASGVMPISGGMITRRDPWGMPSGIQRYQGPMMNGLMGDPGIFGDIWGGIKSVGRVASGIVGGLGIPIVSGVARTAGGMLFGRAPGTSTVPSLPPAPMPPGVWPAPGVSSISMMGQDPCPPGTHRVLGQCVNLPFGGAPGAGITPPPTASMGGYHLNKTGYWLMSGEYIAPGTKWVKNRRRNPGNMKALSRSLGRIKSAKRMTKALSAVSIRKSCPT